jgi:glycosyltransferase involved in cell wall biosynthesis
VVPHGVDDDFGRVEEPALLAAARRRWLGSDRPYALFVGKLSQRRNIPTLIRACARAKLRASLPHSLLLMGPNHLRYPLAEIAAEAGIADSFVQTDGKIGSHAELAAIYSGADAYVNASAYEGFSMTLVEALACGTPVVTVDRAALTEIAGDAAVLVAEPDEEQLADAIELVLTDDELRRRLSALGIDRARMFRWEDTARRTLDVLHEVGRVAR